MSWRGVAAAAVIVACSTAPPRTTDASTDVASAPEVCTVFCKGDDVVAVHLGCISSGVKSASVTAPCAQSAGGPGFHCPYGVGVPFTDCSDVLLGTSAAGTCDVTVTFYDGFVTTSSVTWTAQSSPCCAWLAADETSIVVDDGDASCPSSDASTD